MMERTPEPELMDEQEQSAAYAAADWSEAHEKVPAHFRERFPEFGAGRVLDLGCGTADVTIRFASATSRRRFTRRTRWTKSINNWRRPGCRISMSNKWTSCTSLRGVEHEWGTDAGCRSSRPDGLECRAAIPGTPRCAAEQRRLQ